jgi:hypothetical protein
MRHEADLPHAFINAMLLLDYDRRGLRWLVVPFHVNYYGSSTISKRGAFAHIDGTGSDEARDSKFGRATQRQRARRIGC